MQPHFGLWNSEFASPSGAEREVWSIRKPKRTVHSAAHEASLRARARPGAVRVRPAGPDALRLGADLASDGPLIFHENSIGIQWFS